MIEEGQVVDGDHPGDVRTFGHRVMRAVEHIDRQAADKEGKEGLLPDQPGRARRRGGVDDRGIWRQGDPPAPVASPAHQREFDIGPGMQGSGQRKKKSGIAEAAAEASTHF